MAFLIRCLSMVSGSEGNAPGEGLSEAQKPTSLGGLGFLILTSVFHHEGYLKFIAEYPCHLLGPKTCSPAEIRPVINSKVSFSLVA
jgi:hypothetical protein